MENKIDNNSSGEWQSEHDRLKVLWVVCVLAFWFTFAFQIFLFFLDGQINFVLISIIGGMMILGIALKLKLQRHIRKKP